MFLVLLNHAILRPAIYLGYKNTLRYLPVLVPLIRLYT